MDHVSRRSHKQSLTKNWRNHQKCLEISSKSPQENLFRANPSSVNSAIDRSLAEIRLKGNQPKAEDFSWFHRQSFAQQLDWRQRLTAKLD